MRMTATSSLIRWTRTQALRFHWTDRDQLAQLALNPSIREKIERLCERFQKGAEAYHALRLPWRYGIFLYGPSGSGKTACSRALARTLGWTHWTLPAHEILDSHLLETALAEAVEQPHRVIVLEDVDRMIRTMDPETFFTLLDHAMDRSEGLIWVATTKHPELTPKTQLIRPGRLDETWRMDLPSPSLRKEILMNDFVVHFFATLNEDEEQLLTALVEETAGLSFAHFEELRQIAAQLKLEDRIHEFWTHARIYIQDQIISGDRWGGLSDQTLRIEERVQAVDPRVLEAALDMTDVFRKLMEKVIADAAEKSKTEQFEQGSSKSA